MTGKSIISCIAAVLTALFCITSCEKEPVRERTLVTFSFSTGALNTRAVTPGDSVVADGGGIYSSAGEPDLVILVADADSDIVMRYPINGELVSLTEAEATVSFDFGARDAGSYIVYAFANTEGLWTMTTDPEAVPENTYTYADLKDPAKISTAGQLEALQFKPLAADTPPAVLNGRLPLSAKGDMEVSSNKNAHIHLELLRCVAKVTAEFINNTGLDITLSSYTNVLKDMCPDRGYVVPHTVDSPAGTAAGDLRGVEPSLFIAADDSLSRQWFVFPGTGPYTCDIAFTYGGKNYTYNGLHVVDSRMVNIPAIARNDHLYIVTRISKGLTVSFNFEVAGWVTDDAQETVEFD